MDLRTRIIISADDQSRQGFNSVRSGLDQLNRQANQVRNALLGVFGVSLGVGLIKQLADTADEYKLLNSAIKLSTKGEEEFTQAQTELFAISQRTSTGLRENVDLFRRVSASVRDMGSSQERAFNIIELIDKSIALSGVSATTSAAGIQQFNQGLGSGVLRGEEFNSVMENTPRLAQALADGLRTTKGALREMAEQGKLTTDVVLGALESQAEVLNKEFTAVPATIGRALVKVGNSWTVFLGQLNDSKGATTSVAEGLNAIANNMQQLVTTGYTLVAAMAGLWSVKFVSGITQATAAVLSNALATRGAAAAHEQLFQTELRRLQVSAASSLNLIKEAALQRKLAATEYERVLANKALDAAYAKHAANVAALTAQNALMTRSMWAEFVAASALTKVFTVLNAAFGLFVAWEVGKVIGEWLTQFDLVRKAGSYLAETWVLLVTGIEGLFKGISARERWAQVKQIHAEFAQLRADDAAGTQAAEAKKARAVEEAAAKQAAAWKTVQESVKALSTIADEQFAKQNADLQRHLAERLALIDASDAGELQKEELRAQAVAQAAQAEIDLAKSTADEKLRILTTTADAQIQKLRSMNQSAEQVDRASIEKRKAIYTELAQHYSAVVDRLAQDHNREVQAARAAAESLKQLALNHQFELNDIERAGANEFFKVQSEKSEFEQTLYDASKEIAKGKAGDQEKINTLLSRAKELTSDIGQSEISLAESDTEIYAARAGSAQRLNRLYEEQKTALQQVQKAHEDNADTLAKKQQDALEKLNEVNRKISEITDNLRHDLLLQINVEDSEIDVAKAKIDSIPRDKYVTVHVQTVDEGGSGSGGNVQAQQTGGPIQRFAVGGWPRANGQIPGYGGGDKVKLLAEEGEFVVRKEGVRQLRARFGDRIMWTINRGELPIKRAMGGNIDNWKNVIGGIGQSKGYSYTPIVTGYKFGLEGMANAAKKLLELSEQALAGKIEALKIDLNSLAFAPAFMQSARPGEVRQFNQRLMDLAASQITLQKNISLKVKVPAPTLPNFNANAQASGAKPASSDTVTVQFKAPSGRKVTGEFHRTDVSSVLQVLKESGAVTV